MACHAPSVEDLIKHFKSVFDVPGDGYSFREFTGIIENKFGRKRLIEALRTPFEKVRPTGGLLNLPLYKWKSIFTTNYDNLIEQCYSRQRAKFDVYESNFDFKLHEQQDSVKIFKLHGSLDKDISDGHSARIIITDSDYDHTQAFREGLYDRFKADLFGSDLIIIGHSLADEDIKAIANRAAEISTKTGGLGKLTLFMYNTDINRAQLWEKRGFQVCFGGVDDFFAAVAKGIPFTSEVIIDSSKLLDCFPNLRPTSVDVSHAVTIPSDASKIFNGWPAMYADVQAGLTFRRNLSPSIELYLEQEDCSCAVIVGAAGCGKTTLARQIMLHLQDKGYQCFEHKVDFELLDREWIDLAKSMTSQGQKAALFIDDAHMHLHQINFLLNTIMSDRVQNLKILISSTRNHWYPRVKSAAFFKISREFSLGKLMAEEVESVLNLVDSNPEIRALVEESFSGFSRYEKRRRLIDQCESETFVCLKNIFSTEKFDDIILREYAGLSQEYQEIYRLVAAMESSGVRVHRQMVIRLLGIHPSFVSDALLHLTDIINEYPVSEREGIYGWRGRHSVIMSILTKYKFPEIEMLTDLFEKIIDSISPTYDIEVRTIRELCNVESGLPRIPDKVIQNRLLRKMMSIAPGERIPRHRLIRNLIEMGDFEKGEAEIRIFEKDFGADAPVTRYRIHALEGRALRSPGLLEEDRIAILIQAKNAAISAAMKYPDNRLIIGALCEIGIQIWRKTGNFETYDLAIAELKESENRIGDPEISKAIRKFERQMASSSEDFISSTEPNEESNE